MNPQKEASAAFLHQHELLTEQQLLAVKAYRSLGIFSLHNELLFMLYLAVLLVSGGIGILVYEHIDNIGHTALIGLLFVAVAACFYASLRKAPAFSRLETFFVNPVFDYVVLLGTLLAGTFFSYLQYQYSPLGDSFALAALFTSILGFAAAYRFDNRSALSVAITALATAIGITVTPRAMAGFSVFDDPSVFYYGLGLALALVCWAEYCQKTALKTHFAPVFYGFALHLCGICCIAGMLQDQWPLFGLLITASLLYFFRKSYSIGSAATFVFGLLYGFVCLNIAIIRVLMAAGIEFLFYLSAYTAPFFYMVSIYLFIKAVRKFNRDKP